MVEEGSVQARRERRARRASSGTDMADIVALDIMRVSVKDDFLLEYSIEMLQGEEVIGFASSVIQAYVFDRRLTTVVAVRTDELKLGKKMLNTLKEFKIKNLKEREEFLRNAPKYEVKDD